MTRARNWLKHVYHLDDDMQLVYKILYNQVMRYLTILVLTIVMASQFYKIAELPNSEDTMLWALISMTFVIFLTDSIVEYFWLSPIDTAFSERFGWRPLVFILLLLVVAFLPQWTLAIAIMSIGWIIGRIAGGILLRLTDRVGLNRTVLETPLGRMFGGTERSVSRALSIITRWIVYTLAILTAANVLSVPVLSEWISTAFGYLPAFVSGLLVILLGFVLADFVGDAMLRTRAITRTGMTAWFARGTRLFLYFTAIVIGLDTMGLNVGILYVFARALAWGFAAAIAIGVGAAFGWFGATYVHDLIGQWQSERGEQVDRFIKIIIKNLL